MANWKYVMMRVEVAGTPSQPGSIEYIPIIFAPEITHLDMAEAMMRSFSRKRRMANPRSAGFVHFSCNIQSPTFTVWGESESLRMKTHDDDGPIMVALHFRNQLFYD